MERSGVRKSALLTDNSNRIGGRIGRGDGMFLGTDGGIGGNRGSKPAQLAEKAKSPLRELPTWKAEMGTSFPLMGKFRQNVPI